MYGHRLLLLGFEATCATFLCFPAFAQHPASPQNQSASPSQFTVNVSKGTVVSPPVNSAWSPMPPDVRTCLNKVVLDLLGAVGDLRELVAVQRTSGFVTTPVVSGLEIFGGGQDRDLLHVEWASAEAGVAYVPGIGSAYGVVSDLLEAKVRWDLAQQGVNSIDERDARVIALKDQATQQANQLLADNSPLQLVGNTDPLAVINSAVNQALNSVTGRPLILVDPIDEFVASQQAGTLAICPSCPPYQEPGSGPVLLNVPTRLDSPGPADSGALNSSGGIVIDSQIVSDSPAPANGITIDTQFVSNTAIAQGPDASGGVQVLSELVDDRPPTGLSVMDAGSLTQPQDGTPATSNGRWQTWLQLGLLGLQAWGQWDAAHSTRVPAASAQRRRAQLPPSKKPWCTGPPELCAALQLNKATCSIRNDCSKYAWVPAPPRRPRVRRDVHCNGL